MYKTCHDELFDGRNKMNLLFYKNSCSVYVFVLVHLRGSSTYMSMCHVMLLRKIAIFVHVWVSLNAGGNW